MTHKSDYMSIFGSKKHFSIYLQWLVSSTK